MEFYSSVEDLYSEIPFECPKIEDIAKFKEFLRDMVFNDRKCLVYGDYDPDGLFSTLIVKESFHLMGYNNFEIYKYSNRTHALDHGAKHYAIDGDFNYIFISDTGSSHLEDVEDMVNQGIRVIIIDHHETSYVPSDFPEQCVLINSTILNKMYDSKLYVSAAALVFILMYSYLQDCRIDGKVLSAYALSSMYADSVDMSSKFARGLYTLATSIPQDELPIEIAAFLNNRKRFTRRFVEFDMTPKLNAAFRNENFHILNECLLCKERASLLACIDMVEFLVGLHKKTVGIVKRVSDLIYTEELDYFVIGNLDSVNNDIDVFSNKLYNLTGLVANRLAERYKKSAVVICSNDGCIKGSFRDHLSRDYLTKFQSICEAGGHASAFGFKLGSFEVQDFLRYIHIIDDNFSVDKAGNEPVVINSRKVDESLLQDMAKYNEFSGMKHPIALLKIPRTSEITERENSYGGFNYKWEGRLIVSQKRVGIGEDLLVRPTIALTLRLYAV